MSSKKLKEYNNYLIQNNIEGTLELANAFYVAYASGYANSSEDSYSESDKSEQILILKQEIQKRDAEIELYSNAFKTADELRISSAERYDKEIQKLRELIKEAKILLTQNTHKLSQEQWLSDVNMVEL